MNTIRSHLIEVYWGSRRREGILRDSIADPGACQAYLLMSRFGKYDRMIQASSAACDSRYGNSCPINAEYGSKSSGAGVHVRVRAESLKRYTCSRS